MQMKRSIRSRANDVLFVLICLSGASFSIWKFRNELNRALVKLNEKPIADITFKYKTAQRRFIDRVLWDRLRQHSPVYNGDVIRTAPESEATVYFSDGNVMELYENTLAQMFLKKTTGASVDFTSGDISVRASETGMEIRSGTSLVTVDKGTALTAAKAVQQPGTAGAGLSLQVQEGNASLSAGGQIKAIEAGTAVSLDETGSTIEESPLTVTYPSPNARLMNTSADPMNIRFTCRFTGTKPESAVIETASDRDFHDVERKVIDTIDDIELQEPAGQHYWRIYTGAGGKVAASGRFTVLYTPAPEPVAPAASYRMHYRTQKPAVRFIWTGNDWASSYQFNVSASPDMTSPVIQQRSPQESSIVSSLGEGTWYWQVTPFYAIDNVGLGTPSKIFSFTIVKSGELKAPELMMPSDNGLVNTGKGKNAEAAQGTVSFSWQNDPEAISYTIKAGQNASLSSPAITGTTSDNYFRVITSKHPVPNGRWYWQVTLTDVEGNTVTSPVHTFYAVDAEVEQRTLFPPDGYQVADSRTTDLRYSWKTNIPFATRFQLSSDSSFATCIVDQETEAASAAGRQLVPGEYWWRITADLAGLNLKTAPKKLIVLPPLAKPDVISPADNTRAVVRPATPYEYTWKPVDTADYYEIKLYTQADEQNPVFERSFYEDTSIKIDMEHMKEIPYVWTVQAFREETPMSSRATGYLAKNAFVMKKLRPIDLLTPDKEAVLDGVQSIKKPGQLTWSSVDRTAESCMFLYKEYVSDANIVLKQLNPAKKFQLPRLYAGRYFWKVTGRTEDDLDVSSLETRSFTVTPVPKLPASQNLQPVDGTVFGTAYLRKNRSIQFTWNAVPNADRYILTIYRGEKEGGSEDTADVQILDKKTLSYTYADLAKLNRGSFTWTVEAQSLYETALLQEGVHAVSHFTIDLPKLNAPVVNRQGELYGR